MRLVSVGRLRSCSAYWLSSYHCLVLALAISAPAMEDASVPLESVRFWSESVPPSRKCMVKVLEGSLLQVSGACLWEERGMDKGGVGVLQAKSGSRDSFATLCVLQPRLPNANLSTYFENDVEFRNRGTGTIHLHGHFVDIALDAPPANSEVQGSENDIAEKFKAIRERTGAVESTDDESSSADGDSSDSGSEASPDSPTTRKRQAPSDPAHGPAPLKKTKAMPLNKVDKLVQSIIMKSPTRSVKLSDMGMLFQKESNVKFKEMEGTNGKRMGAYLKEKVNMYVVTPDNTVKLAKP